MLSVDADVLVGGKVGRVERSGALLVRLAESDHVDAKGLLRCDCARVGGEHRRGERGGVAVVCVDVEVVDERSACKPYVYPISRQRWKPRTHIDHHLRGDRFDLGITLVLRCWALFVGSELGGDGVRHAVGGAAVGFGGGVAHEEGRLRQRVVLR